VRDFHAAEELPPMLTLPYLPNALRCAALMAEFVEGIRAGSEVDQESILRTLHRSFLIAPTQVEEMLREIELRMTEVAALFDVDLGRYIAIDRVLSQAQTTLADLALQSQLEVASTQRSLRNTQEELEHVKLQSQVLQHQAECDGLTGACVRATLDHVLPQTVRECENSRQRLGVLFLDADDFKSINDQYGHAAGDKVLQHVVAAIRSSVRENDLVVRYGGDEFVVVLAVSGHDALMAIAERIREGIQQPVKPRRGESVQVTCSIGGVVYSPVRGVNLDAERLLDEADQAMYAAKQSGGNLTLLLAMKGEQVEPVK
jgi:diguanylate cyclase (GGDEF)-like protein